jgi:hypothetical protein
VGSAVYGALVVNPVLNSLPVDQRAAASTSAQARFRAFVQVMLLFAVGSGLYNLLTGPVHTTAWHAVFGVKILLVLHILASAVMWAVSPNGDVAVAGKGKRRLAGIAISGLLVILLSAVLRIMTQRGF